MRRFFLFALLSLVISAPLHAQDNWQTWPTGDRFTMGVEAFYINTDTDLAIKLVDIGEIGFDLEDALGLNDSETIVTLAASWRFAKRHSFAYRYFNLDRRSPTLFEGDDFLINPYVEIDFENHDLTYNYSFLFDEKRDFFGGIGLSAMSFDFVVKDAGEVLPDFGLESSPPVPNFLLGYNWALSPKWVWLNQVNFLAVDWALDDEANIEGSIWQLNTRLEWRVMKHLSLTASYEYADLEVESGDGLVRLKFQDQFKGPRVGAVLRF